MGMKLKIIAALAAAAPLAAQVRQAAPIPEAALVKRVAATVDSLVALQEFSGVVLLAKDGKPVFERAYGFADREAKKPNTMETAFNIGSINKLFTQIALRQLAADGKLNLDSSLATCWPDYPNGDIARRVTIRQIMQHRSGIGGDIFAAPVGKTRHDIRHNRDYLPLFVDNPLEFEPGTRQKYSNAGYVVLGMLVERLSGTDYYRYVQERIYRQAGMTRTGAWAPDSLPPNTAIGYTREDGALTRNTARLPGRGSAAGGGYTTAYDLMRFMVALRQKKVANAPEAGNVGVAGGAGGLNAVLEGDLPGGYDLIVLANLDPPAAERVSRLVRGWLGGDD
jgi:CubicO group peptidase (beta-lactamase class C family)